MFWVLRGSFLLGGGGLVGWFIEWEFIERLGKDNTMWMRTSRSLHLTMELVNSALVLFVMVKWPGYFSVQEIVCYTSSYGYFHSFSHVFLLVSVCAHMCLLEGIGSTNADIRRGHAQSSDVPTKCQSSLRSRWCHQHKNHHGNHRSKHCLCALLNWYFDTQGLKGWWWCFVLGSVS